MSRETASARSPERREEVGAQDLPPKLEAVFSDAEIESGRRLFAAEWAFRSAASSLDSLPPMAGVEIAFAGRSNVGKSSLDQCTHRPPRSRAHLEYAGTYPGIDLLRRATPAQLVDMPGYGYAAAAKTKVKAWTRLIENYLRGRATLARVYLLVDARHGLKAADEPVLDALSAAAVSHEIVLTKCDQIEAAALAERIAAVAMAVRKRPAAFPELIATSARSGAGIAELRAAIARLLAERAR